MSIGSAFRKTTWKFLRPISRRIANRIMFERQAIACSRAKKLLPNANPDIAAYLAKQRSEGGLYHHFSELKALELWQTLQMIQPKTILELGTGLTTAILSQYMNNHPELGCHMVSVDESEKYMNQTRDRLNSPSNIRFVHCPRLDDPSKKEVRYTPSFVEELGGKEIDLVYVDGPTCKDPDDPTKQMPCIDVVALQDEGFKINNILFDYRLRSVEFLRDSKYAHLFQIDEHYSMRTSEAWGVREIRHHSMFRRWDNC